MFAGHGILAGSEGPYLGKFCMHVCGLHATSVAGFVLPEKSETLMCCVVCARCACGHRERLVEGVGPTLGRRSALACYAVYLRREYFRFLNRRAYELTRDVISRRASLRLLHVRVRHAKVRAYVVCARARRANESRARVASPSRDIACMHSSTVPWPGE